MDFSYTLYPPVIRWALRNRLVVLILAFGVLLATGGVAQFLGSELIPEMSQGEFFVSVELPVGTPLTVTESTIRDLEDVAEQIPEVRTVYSIIGSAGSSGGSSGEERENIGQINVALEEGVIRDREERVMEQLRHAYADFPSVATKFSRPSLFTSKTPIEVEVSGYNLSTLQDLSDTVMDRLSNVSGLTDLKTSAEGGNPEVQIRFNRHRVAQLGTTISSIGQIIRNQVQGEVATEFTRGDRKVDIRVRASEENRSTVDDLQRLIVSPANSPTPIPLAVVADLTIEMGPAEIRRIDQERVAIISANIEGRDLSDVVIDIESEIRQIVRAPDYSIKVGGQNEERERSFQSMQMAIALAIFLVYLVMASQFESLVHPLVIMFSIPFGLVGVVLILLVTGQTVSVVVLIGLIMLAGIVVNNAIVLIDYINMLRRDQKVPKLEAIEQACRVRLRPILMTTSTTVLGLLPMALGIFNLRPLVEFADRTFGGILPDIAHMALMAGLNLIFPVGQGSEIRAPMAITVIGGLGFSTLVTLILIPTIYSLSDRKS
jgi:HAE1 family hydrophobic/amphiphilic exporter-1